MAQCVTYKKWIMFKRKHKDTCSTTDKKEFCQVPSSDFRVEFNRVISQIHARSSTQDDKLEGTLGRLKQLEAAREMEVVCVKNAIRKNDSVPPSVNLHFGSIIAYSTDQASHKRVDIGENRSDFSEMRRRLEQNLNQSCRFKQHAKLERAETKLAGDALGSDSHSDSDSARGRSASSSGSCNSPGESLCGSGSDCETEQLDQQELDEFMLDKFAHECKISLSTASVLMKPTIIEVDTPLKENMRNEEFIETQNDIMTIDKVVTMHSDLTFEEPNTKKSSAKDSDHIYEYVAEVNARREAAQASAVSAWLAKRGIVLEDYDKVIQPTTSKEQIEDEIKVVTRRFIKYDPKSRRRVDAILSIFTDSQYSSDESTNAVKNPDHSECSASETSEASESRDTVILGSGDLQLGIEPMDGGNSNASARNVRRVSVPISSRDERREAPSPAPITLPVEPIQSSVPIPTTDKVTSSSPVLRSKKSFKALRVSCDRHAAVEEELIEVLPNVRRLASKFHFEGDGVDWKNKYHSLTGRSLSKEFRQKQLQAKPSLPRTARFEEASAATLERRLSCLPVQLFKIHESANKHVQPIIQPTAQSQPRPSESTGSTHRETQTQTSDDPGKKKKKQRSKSQNNKKGFFDREILARLSKFQQFI